MDEAYDYGTRVRVVRSLRNDGTYPGLDRGDLLVRRGSVGVVIGRGTFLQDQVIYSVRFLDVDRVVGCRDRELIPADAPWVPSRFASRDRVRPRVPLGIRGAVVVPAGTPGEVMRVLTDRPSGVTYHVNFHGRILEVPETALAAPQAPEEEETG
ncbi:nitrogen fixation protein NifZ [Ectothiorhodospira mobilis]|uniref:nitrogen fixation protein NifZ n=1 Tax=Ectothiorhodospira mobilis TaxID=195064 RepID=UPI001905E5BD|nr:nitrogen fixation protein NifZ [Ectothiorhodospira mobilis]MBK1690631.1 nitrogen fixation protein NifZ [Ectothiorhodospira mobilis]